MIANKIYEPIRKKIEGGLIMMFISLRYHIVVMRKYMMNIVGGMTGIVS